MFTLLIYTELAAISIVENQKRACQLIRTAEIAAAEGGRVAILGTGSSLGSEVAGVGSGVGSTVGDASGGAAGRVGSGVVGDGVGVLVAGVGSDVVALRLHVCPA